LDSRGGRGNKAKEAGIKVLTEYRDAACATSKGADEACTELFNTVISRRAAENQQLLQMLAVAKSFPAKERDELLGIEIPAYQRMNDDTPNISKEATRRYKKP
jgi:hypothetical protein